MHSGKLTCCLFMHQIVPACSGMYHLQAGPRYMCTAYAYDSSGVAIL